MKDTTIAPYILNHQKKIQRIRESLKRERMVRCKSSVFSLRGCKDWKNVHVISLRNQSPLEIEGVKWSCSGVIPKNRNTQMVLNETAILEPTKVIFFALQEVEEEIIQKLYDQILQCSDDLLIRNREGLMISMEMFGLAQGLDELLELPEDALDDLTLRAELIGAEILSEGWNPSDIAKCNVEKGRLFVNSSSDLFS